MELEWAELAQPQSTFVSGKVLINTDFNKMCGCHVDRWDSGRQS